jgi:hypothetical protein
MEVTLNKDGTPRKIGSGKTKGAGCFAKIKWKQLKEFISEEDEILVGRVWLRSVGALNQKRGSKKKQPKNLNKNPSKLAPSPKQYHPKDYKPAPKITKAVLPASESNDGDEYEPPPLFASIGEIKKY